MTGLEKYEAWLDKGNEILNLRKEGDNRVWVSKDEALAKARRLLAEEKAGDEGLREFVVRIVERAKYLGHSRVDLPVRILEKSLEMYPSRPVSEQKAQKEEQ